MLRQFILASAGLLASAVMAQAAEPSTPTVEYGKLISILGGCNDCHTPGYNETGGQIDPAKALIGNKSGFQGPWGTTYPTNLRLLAQGMTEDGWVSFLKTFKARPPMPFYNVHAMDDIQMRSLYVYIASLGAPGDPAPDYVPPGGEVKFPYVVEAPPTIPKE